MKKLEKGILYLSFHNLLKKKFGINKIISRKLVFMELGRHFLVPKNLRNAVLKELECMKLIRIKNKNSLVILNSKMDLEKDANLLFRKMRLF